VPDTTASTGHVAVAQLRVSVSTLTADTRQRFGLADSDACPDCGDPDSVSHLLLDCLAYITGGALSPTLGEVFDQDGLDIWSYLQEEGLVPPDEEERWSTDFYDELGLPIQTEGEGKRNRRQRHHEEPDRRALVFKCVVKCCMY